MRSISCKTQSEAIPKPFDLNLSENEVSVIDVNGKQELPMFSPHSHSNLTLMPSVSLFQCFMPNIDFVFAENDLYSYVRFFTLSIP